MINIEKLKVIQDYLAINNQPKKSDIIFVFGGLRMPKTWKQSLKLYQAGYAPKILITGGFGPMTKELNSELPEAEMIKQYLVEKGVPQEDIIIEIEATNTLENVIWGMKELYNNSLIPKAVIAVSKPFHMRRCLATFQKHFPELEVLCCPPDGNITELMDRPPEEYYQRLLGEVKRLQNYADKGDIVRQDIPEEILQLVGVL